MELQKENAFGIEYEVSEVRNRSTSNASAGSNRSSSENEVEERSVETELAEDSIRVVQRNEGGINLLVGESLPKRQQEDPDIETIIRRRLITDEVPTCEELEAEIQKSVKTRAKVVHSNKLKEYLGKPPKSWLAIVLGELDEVSRLGEAGASAERALRSPLNG